jgi:hypothetical protein
MFPTALLCSCLARTVVGAVDSSYVIDLQAEAHERTLSIPGDAPSSAFELVLQPGLQFSLAGRSLQAAVGYRPDLTFDERAEQHVALLHHGSLTSSLKLDRRWRLTGSAAGSYGTANMTQIVNGGPEALPGAPPAPAQPVPFVNSIKYVSGVGALGIDGILSSRVHMRSAFEVFLNGGADAEAQVQLPLERGARVLGGLDWNASPRGVLASGITATASELSFGSTAFIVLLTETWRFAATAQTQLSVGAGVSYTSSRVDGQVVEAVRSSGELGLSWMTRSHGVTFRTANVLATLPNVDRMTGRVVYRATASTTNTLTLRSDWRFDASGSGGVEVQGPNVGDTFWTAEGRAAWVSGPSLEVYLGGRGVWSLQGLNQGRTYDWTALVGMTLRQAGHF